VRAHAQIQLAERGATLRGIASVLGHKSERQAWHYSQEADRKKMARDAMALLTDSEHQVSNQQPDLTLESKKAAKHKGK